VTYNDLCGEFHDLSSMRHHIPITWNIIVFRKFRKSQHEYLEFGPKSGEIKKKPAKKYTSVQGGGGQTQKSTTFCAKLSFIRFLTSSFLFPERPYCCCIYLHCSYMYNYYNYLEPCALNVEFQHFIFRFNKTSYFADLIKEGTRGWKVAQRQDDFNENSIE